MRSYAHLNTVRSIIDSYPGDVPFAAWLKQFFKENRKFGSSDRKMIGHACHCYYRLGNGFRNLEPGERILTALFLCSSAPNRMVEELRPEWLPLMGSTLERKLEVLSAEEELANIFPFPEELSAEVNRQEFSRSFLIQPDLFLRIRPGRENMVINRLKEAGIGYRMLPLAALVLPNQTRIQEVIQVDKDAVVQDLSSQQVIDPLKEVLTPESTLSVWDCCAASGGKSILFHDHFPKAHLTVSDIRQSILINLRNRFLDAGIRQYDCFIGDVSSGNSLTQKKFDVVICDAPCSGSGTWSRTPEQLLYFKKEKIGYYAGLQKRIARNVSGYLKRGGYFLYVTCSVFKKENEEVVAYIEKDLSLKLQTMQYFKGYKMKADTMFAALFSL